MKSAIIISSNQENNSTKNKTAEGNSFIIHEWQGSGPDYLHVHYEDDEAWFILEGELDFHFADKTFVATKGDAILVPAGVAHTYTANASARYLIILTPRLDKLISELHTAPYSEHAAIMKRYKSEIL